MKSTLSYDDIIDDLAKEKELCFFCGAGISFNSGLPVVSQIIKTMVMSLSGSLDAAEQYFLQHSRMQQPFEAFMQRVIQYSNDDQLLEIFERGKPNANHMLIAGLCKLGLVRKIFTTNFDNLIEHALVEQGLVNGTDFHVLDDEQSFQAGLRLYKDSRKVLVFKIHGNIDKRSSIRTTLDSITRNDWMKQRGAVIRQMVNGNSNKTLVIMGYSFSDIFDIIPVILTAKPSPDQKIITINHIESGTEVAVSSDPLEMIKRDKKPSFQGAEIRISTDAFTKDLLCKFCDIPTVEFVVSKLIWRNKIDKWVRRMPLGIREYILAELFFKINDLKNALLWNEKAMNEAGRSGFLKLTVDLYSQRVAMFQQVGEKEEIKQAKQLCKVGLKIAIGIRYVNGISRLVDLMALIRMYNEDDFENAKRLYLVSLHLKDKVNDFRGQAIGLLSIGSCYRHEQLFDDAILSAKKSIDIRKCIGDISGIGRCYQGLGNVYLEKSDAHTAIMYFKKFERIALDVGDEWTVATARYKLGEGYLLKNTKRGNAKAMEYCEQSLAVRCTKSNREHVNCLFLKGKILSAQGKNKEAKILLEDVLVKRRSFNNEADLADSYFELGLIYLKEGDALKGIENLLIARETYSNKGYRLKVDSVDKHLNTGV